MASVAYPSLSTAVQLPGGTTYGYVHVKPQGAKPYLLFLHGFPDTSYVWKRQIDYFSSNGYGLVVPDLLGYGDTDKPKKLEAYKLKKMAQEMVEILDSLEIKRAVGIGHDWGSFLLSRLANYHSVRFISFAFLGVAYQPPTGEPFSIEAINQKTTATLGYPIFGYWFFFDEAEAGKIIDDHPASMRSLRFAADPIFTKDNVCYPGACRSYFVEGKTGPIADWPLTEEIDMYKKIMSHGGFGPPLNWYKCYIANLNTPDEAEILEDSKQIKVPSLLVTSAHDPVAPSVLQEESMRPFAKDVIIKSVNAGHWLQQEKAEEVNKLLEGLLLQSEDNLRLGAK